MAFYFSNRDTAVLHAGGKGTKLFELLKLGFAVPGFAVIPADFFSSLPSPDQYQFPENTFKSIREYFNPGDFLAVRSSGTDEDGTHFSFAGQFETLLYVKPSQLEDAVKTVWASANSERVTQYRQANHLPAQQGIAVIVQRMVNSEVSGVAFGINPLNGNSNEKVINAVYGLGEGLVSGALDADLYIVSDKGTESKPAHKNEAFVLDTLKGYGTTREAVNAEKQDIPVLNEKQVREITVILDKLQEHFKQPQDIEFAYENNKLYLLQSRPVTTKAKTKTITWDNSNIIESYPGVTLPLTYSFIIKMYEAVYRQLSMVMGVTGETVEANSAVYANMLGLLRGRVYYNLNSWYKSLSLLPGYNINAAFMENMMGVKERFELDTKPQKAGIKDYWNIVTAVFKIIRNHNTIEKQRKEFQEYFNRVMAEYEAIDLSKRSAAELMQDYLRFEHTLVTRWKAPLVNDFFCMIYFGVLQKLVKKYELDETGTLHNDLVSGAKDIISTEPIRLGLHIAKEISGNKEAYKLFTESDEIHIWQELHKPEFSSIKASIDHYIKHWGERCVAELKLETITYKQEPERYIKILKAYVNRGLTQQEQTHSRLRGEAEALVARKLKGKWLKRCIFNYVLKKARYLVSNRENLRYERTRGFGMVRILFAEMGKRLYEAGRIDAASDIFYLSQQEIFDEIRGTAIINLKALVKERKQTYAVYEKESPPERIVTAKVFSDKDIPRYSRLPEHSGSLKGIGCCAGIVRARVKIISSPSEIDSLDGDILVTSSTDPGWVTLFPSASGILVERGSLLSHSAIVSREMGIPCIVGITGLLQQLKSGDLVEMDGASGTVAIIEK